MCLLLLWPGGKDSCLFYLNAIPSLKSRGTNHKTGFPVGTKETYSRLGFDGSVRAASRKVTKTSCKKIQNLQAAK
jgi:hypothetical protein